VQDHHRRALPGERRVRRQLRKLLRRLRDRGLRLDNDHDDDHHNDHHHGPRVCGNGIIEGAEWCDGDEFCESNCTIRRFACCEFATPSGGTCSATVPAFTLFVYQSSVCGRYGGTFWLGRVAPTSERCSEPLGGGYPYAEQTGPCVPAPELSQPASVCCQGQETPSICTDITTASQEGITLFVWSCLYRWYPYEQPVVAGTCGADGRCVPAH
jgi:hypothetical protein